MTGIYGFNNTARMMLSLAVARLMSEHGNTLFINFETFYGFKGILKDEENENLSDALYAFRQNHNQFHKNIVNAISHYERLDYIPDASCAEDIDDIKPEEIGTFIQAIGRELGYSNIVIDIGDGIRMPWNMMDCCDEIYICETGNYIENMRFKILKNIFLSRGWIILQQLLKRYMLMKMRTLIMMIYGGGCLFAVFMKNYAEQQE